MVFIGPATRASRWIFWIKGQVISIQYSSIQKGMEEKSKEFAEKGNELYAKA